MKAGSWRCYGCNRTQPRIEVECRCEWWKRMAPWLREMLGKLICDISPEPFPSFVSRAAEKARGLDRAPGNS